MKDRVRQQEEARGWHRNDSEAGKLSDSVAATFSEAVDAVIESRQYEVGEWVHDVRIRNQFG